MPKNLADLSENEEGFVINCSSNRLLEHGFVPGTPFKIYKKISGITCVYIRGAVIAGRDEDYKNVLVNLYKINDESKEQQFL